MVLAKATNVIGAVPHVQSEVVVQHDHMGMHGRHPLQAACIMCAEIRIGGADALLAVSAVQAHDMPKAPGPLVGPLRVGKQSAVTQRVQPGADLKALGTKGGDPFCHRFGAFKKGAVGGLDLPNATDHHALDLRLAKLLYKDRKALLIDGAQRNGREKAVHKSSSSILN